MKMSKRAGNYITMRDVLGEVGVDAIRFVMISRNANKKIDFDLDIFLQKNKDNLSVLHSICTCEMLFNNKYSKEKFKELNIEKKII